MTRQSPGKYPAYSAFSALDAIGRAIHDIKAQDGLTWADIGAVLGVSDDQAAKYAEGTATMNAVTFGRGKREWNGRFTGYFDLLCEISRPGPMSDHAIIAALTRAVADLAEALENGDEIYEWEVRKCLKTISRAEDAIEALHGKLRAVS